MTYHCEFTIAENIKFEDDLGADQLSTLEAFTTDVMQALKLDSPMSIAVHIANDPYVHEMNRSYRGVDSPTDILSFPTDDLPEEIAAEEDPHLGDLVMAYGYIVSQAQREGHSALDEFKMLIIHGILHLLGYDHQDDESQQDMWQQQRDLLAKFAIDIELADYVHGRDDEAEEA